MQGSSLKVLSEYGVGVFLTFVALTAIFWVMRVSLKNPIDVLSGALADVDKARRALRDENAHKDQRIEDQSRRIEEQSQKIIELEKEIDEQALHIEQLTQLIQKHIKQS